MINRWQSHRMMPVYLFLLLAAGTTLALTAVLKTAGRTIMLEQSRKQLETRNQALVASLGGPIHQVEGIAQSMAAAAANLPQDEELIRRIFPTFLEDGDSLSIIAGGGLWPEPYAFDPASERHSFFWGRGPGGKLAYYDDYNDPDNPPYFREEWYAPAVLKQGGGAYWSRSYLDPYSHEPMTTCTIPYRRDGRVAGVVTVDVKLKGLTRLIRDLVPEGWGYAFLLDRTGRFITFPDAAMHEAFYGEQADQDSDIMPSLVEAVRSQPGLSPYQESLDEFLARDTAATDPDLVDRLADYQVRLLENTNGLSPREARLIADDFIDGDSASLAGVFAEIDDPVMAEKAYATFREIPHTGWILITAASHAAVLAPVYDLSRHLLLGLLTPLLLFIAATVIWVRRRLTGPMLRMSRQLSASGGTEFGSDLPILYQDELGLLAHRFNHQRERLEEAVSSARKATAARTLFLANMSHEIRTPLNGILGAVNLLEDVPGAENRYLVSLVRESSESLLTILNDILDFSKLEAGRFSITREPFDLVAVLEGCLALFSAEGRGRGLDMEFRHELGRSCWVMGDAVRVRQIVTNLLGNAVKFTTRGSVTLEAATRPGRPGEVAIAVRDTGVGIPPEDQEHIFELFTQADNGLSSGSGGTGLGLAICRKLSSLMGGDLTLDSEPDRGSVFTLTLPLPRAERPRADAAGENGGDAAEDLQGTSILLAEDNATNRAIAVRVLEKFGCRVVTAGDGEQAWRKAAAGGVDLVLMDLKMPGMDGIEATRRIRSLDGPASRVPIVALTASIVAEIRDECLRAGMDDFLTKPLKPRDLKAMLLKCTQKGPEPSSEPLSVS